MARHSSTLAWKIPWTEEPGRLQSMGSLSVRHDWVTSFSLFTSMHWRRKWQPTPVFLPGESWGRGSLVACRLWGCTELDTTEAMQQQQHSHNSEKAMATHSSTLSWQIPWTGEPGGLLSLGLHRVGHNWSDLAAAAFPQLGLPGGSMVKNLPANAGDTSCRFNPWFRKIPWSRKWKPTLVFLPGQSHGQRHLEGYSPWGGKRTGQSLVTKQQQQ